MIEALIFIAYALGYLVCVEFLRRWFLKLDSLTGIPEDSFDRFMALFLAMLISPIWPLLLAVRIVQLSIEWVERIVKHEREARKPHTKSR